MLKKDRLYLIFFLFIFSCTNNRPKYDLNECCCPHNFKNYKNIYDIAKDSLQKWIKDSLLVIKPIFFDNYWELDSLFCFNADSSMFISTINERQKTSLDATSDIIEEFGGAKMNNNWYFFQLGTTVVPREYYQDSIYVALSYKELSWLGHKKILCNASIKNANGSFSPNERFFQNMFFDKNSSYPNSHKSIDSLLLNLIKDKYNHKINPKEIVEIRLIIKQSKQPPEPRGFWFRKLFSHKQFN